MVSAAFHIQCTFPWRSYPMHGPKANQSDDCNLDAFIDPAVLDRSDAILFEYQQSHHRTHNYFFIHIFDTNTYQQQFEKPLTTMAATAGGVVLDSGVWDTLRQGQEGGGDKMHVTQNAVTKQVCKS